MFKPVFAAASLSLLAAGCVASAAASSTRHMAASTGALFAEVGPESLPRAWSADAPLSWAEFLGPAPSAGIEGARTVYALRYESRCHGTTFTFDVKAVFLPEQSWVKPDVLANSRERARVLQHEQTHFDLTEVYARRMRKYFAELYNACAQSDEQVSAAIDRFVRQEAEAQQKYDDDSGYGLTPAQQRLWNERVADMLSSLAAFARRPPSS